LIYGSGLLSVGCAGLSPLDYPPEPVLPTGVANGAAAEPMTLPRFLGLDKVCRRTSTFVRAQRERAAQFLPVLSPKPLAIPLSHPDNANSASPTIANVHKMKAKKAAAQVKVKAVAELASYGCAADPHVEEGLLAALCDADAAVREAAAEAVLASTRSCGNGCGGCCSEAIRARLTEMVFSREGPCCWTEPSSRARRLARLALDACGGPLETVKNQERGIPEEVPPPPADS
jgi:hypothetical protein